MKDDELQAIMDSISSKVGEENSALIADDLGNLITKNSSVVDEIKGKDAEIARLNDANQKLIKANGNLLQSIPMGKEPEKKEPEEAKPFNFRSIFDEKGNIKK